MLDDLLREHRLVDLYNVVREGIRISEARYSLKNVERFYRAKRIGEVATAADSIVVYERWRSTGDDSLLGEIEAYNRIDCESTEELRDWLLSLPGNAACASAEPTEDGDAGVEARRARDVERDEVVARLLAGCSEEERPARELVGHLLDFHRREQKPEWWAMFEREGADAGDLVDDAECLGDLKRLGEPEPVKRSFVFTYSFPPQETKLGVGDRPLRSHDLGSTGEIVELDHKRGIVRLKCGMMSGERPEHLSLIPPKPIDARVLRTAIRRFADALIEGSRRYAALRSVLERRPPSIRGLAPGAPVVAEADADRRLEAISRAVQGLEDSHLFIQGPPGAGKTYTIANVICDLIRAGKRIGVTANAHKAINNVLSGAEACAAGRGLTFRGIKKANDGPMSETWFKGRCTRSVTTNDEVDGAADLVAGTAWLFARPEFDEAFDYLFVDEAGQVSLGHLVAMGTAARNIVLVGDQMQLGQPIKGTHPGGAGVSALDHLLGETAVVSPDHGVFLDRTWRMHDDLCRFISDAVYGGRLMPEAGTAKQRLFLDRRADPRLAPTGLRFVEVAHAGCGQRSEREAEVIRALYENLLTQRWQCRDGQEHPIAPDDILVVAPYNVQVNHLRETLPPGARVGTVDKFQGQEAAVVLVSMTTSSAEDMPRGIDFLYSRNRLNVALSRARCLAVIAASPRLLETACRTVEQLRLVNLLCWARNHGCQDEIRPRIGVEYA